MQRTEIELSRRYFRRLSDIDDRWFAMRRRWIFSKTKSNRKREEIARISHLAKMDDVMARGDYWIAACKALGHWPRREL